MDLKDAEGYPIVVGDSYVAVTQTIGSYTKVRNGLVVEAAEDKKGVVYTVREWRADDYTGRTLVCRPEACVVKTKPEELTRRIIEATKRKAAQAANPQPASRLVKRGAGHVVWESLAWLLVGVALALLLTKAASANDVLEEEIREAEIEGRQIPWEPAGPSGPVIDAEVGEAVCRDLAEERGLSPAEADELCGGGR